MTRRSFLLFFLLLFVSVMVLSDELPQVVQPNSTAYSATEVATLTQAIKTLETTPGNYNLGSRRYFTSDQWSSRDFASYTGGILAEKSYETKLVSGAGWPDGVHTWLLIGIPLGGKTAWVPVEASPEAGHSQQVLGYIPSTTDGAGRLWFEESYLNFSDVIELPPNLSPVAKIRLPTAAVVAGESTQFLALTSADPDGEIVLYQWDFGDGKTRISTTWSVRHEYEEAGEYTVSLTVIDDRGKSATTSITLRVVERNEPKEGSSSSDGCGCGK